MPDDCGVADVDRLAQTLQLMFPAADDASLARSLLRLLAGGQPVSAERLARQTGRGEASVAGRLDAWSSVERDNDGDVIAFSGLTLATTAHAFELDRRGLHTWCAWDTLFLPALLEQAAVVRSTCAVTGEPVDLEVSPRGIDHRRPEGLYVSFPPLDTTDTANITGSFCCHVHFLAGADAASAWRTANDGGTVVEIDRACVLGHQAVAALLSPGSSASSAPTAAPS